VFAAGEACLVCRSCAPPCTSRWPQLCGQPVPSLRAPCSNLMTRPYTIGSKRRSTTVWTWCCQAFCSVSCPPLGYPRYSSRTTPIGTSPTGHNDDVFQSDSFVAIRACMECGYPGDSPGRHYARVDEQLVTLGQASVQFEWNASAMPTTPRSGRCRQDTR
jgi:hypothetical protein